MMKKWGMALFLSLFAGSMHVAADGIMTDEQQPVYDTATNEQIGYIVPNIYYETMRETDEQFIVQMETATAYVLKEPGVQTVEKPVAKQKPKQKTIATNKETIFYTATNFSEPMYVAQPNRRFIVTSEANNYYEVRLFGQTAYVLKRNVREDRGVPILLYHHLLKDKENKSYKNNATVDPLTFIVHMDYLKKAGYETVTLDELKGYIKGEQNISAKAFALTFDDGLATTKHYAYELLKAMNFNATNFIITSRTPLVDQLFNPNGLQFLSMKQMNSMRDVFAFHGHTHNLHYLAKGSCGAIVCGSVDATKKDIATSLAVFPHRYFAYPFGQFTDETVQVLKQAGIEMAFTTRKDYVHVGEDLYRVPRIDVQRSMTFAQFKAIFE